MRIKPKKDMKKIAVSLAILLLAGLVIGAGWATPLQKKERNRINLHEPYDSLKSPKKN